MMAALLTKPSMRPPLIDNALNGSQRGGRIFEGSHDKACLTMVMPNVIHDVARGCFVDAMHHHESPFPGKAARHGLANTRGRAGD
jgi:hypothetical protein